MSFSSRSPHGISDTGDGTTRSLPVFQTGWRFWWNCSKCPALAATAAANDLLAATVSVIRQRSHARMPAINDMRSGTTIGMERRWLRSGPSGLVQY